MSRILIQIETAVEEIGADERLPWFSQVSDMVGPVTFGDLLNGFEFWCREGVYVIWREGDARPLYIGMTTKGEQRLLDHLKHNSPIHEIVTDAADWLIFFCPLLSSFDMDLWLPAALVSFERKMVKALQPWFWHGGLQDEGCPYGIM